MECRQSSNSCIAVDVCFEHHDRTAFSKSYPMCAFIKGARMLLVLVLPLTGMTNP